jgi:hypothetical protein
MKIFRHVDILLIYHVIKNTWMQLPAFETSTKKKKSCESPTGTMSTENIPLTSHVHATTMAMLLTSKS